MSYDSEPVKATVAELRPGMKNVTITFKVEELGEAREVSSRSDGEIHRVLDAVVGDTTGIVMVPLWDDTIDAVEAGSTYTLTNGYTGLFRGNLRLNIGRYGQLAEAEEAIDEVNRDVDMSAEEHEDRRRPRRDYGGGGYGGRSYGGSRGYSSGQRRGGSQRRRRY